MKLGFSVDIILRSIETCALKYDNNKNITHSHFKFGAMYFIEGGNL